MGGGPKYHRVSSSAYVLAALDAAETERG